MRHLASGVNRGWLFVLGLLLVLAGVVGTGLTTGWLVQADRMVGLGVAWPGRDAMVVNEAGKALFDTQPAVVGVIIGGVLLVITGLVWLVRQVPRRGLAKPFRLHDDAQAGTTRVDPSVIAAAAARQIETFTGVSDAVVQLRGSARHPEVTVRVTAEERGDIAGIIARIRDRAVIDLQTVLDTTITRLAVQVELDRGRTSTNQITL